MTTARRGFTLVEIMVVVGILGIVSAIVLLPNVLRSRLNANDSIAQTTLKTISNALETYMINNNAYPPDTDLLRAAAPPYLQTDFFDGQPHSGFNYTADTLTDSTYAITAAPLSAPGHPQFYHDHRRRLEGELKAGETGDIYNFF